MDLFKLLGTIAIENAGANSALKETQGHASDTAESIQNMSDEADASGSGMVGAFKKIGTAVVTFLAVDKILAFGQGCIQAAADVAAMESQFTQVFGEVETEASGALSKIADDAGIAENRMKGSFTKIAAFAKTTGMDTEAALGLSERAMVAVADSAAFYDRSLEETTESLQSFLKGNYENDAALGLSCTETTRNEAANKLYGKSFKDLSEAQKQLTLLQMVEDANKASGALGQAARESNTWTNQTGNLKQAWTDLQATLGQPVLEMVTSAVGWLADKIINLTQKFIEGQNPVQTFVDKMQAVWAWCQEVGGYIAQTLSPIIDDIKNGFTALKDAVQPLIDKFNEYVDSGQLAKDATDAVKTAVDLVATAYEKLKGFVTDVVQGFKDMVTWGKENETTLSIIAVAVGTLTAAIVAYNIAQAIKNAGGIAEIAQLGILQVQIWALTAAETAHTVATTIATAATTAFGAVLSFITSPITLVIVAIGALIAIGVALYKNWDVIKEKCSEFASKVKEKFLQIKESISNAIENAKQAAIEKFNALKSSASEKVQAMKNAVTEKFQSLKSAAVEKIESLKSSVVNKFNAIKDGISEKIESAKEAVRNAIEKIKGFFDFNWSLPHIKLPHFSISGKFSLDPPSIPKIGVDWYAKAMDNPMIMDKPTIFGYNAATGKFQGGGEAGSEVVSGTNTLMNMISAAVSGQNAEFVAVLYKILEAILAMDENMGGNLREALAGTSFEINKREFARLVKAVN